MARDLHGDLAVDAVGAEVLRYEAAEIDHLRRAGEAGLGCADLSKIKLVGDLSPFTERYPYLPARQIPDSARRIYGREMACANPIAPYPMDAGQAWIPARQGL